MAGAKRTVLNGTARSTIIGTLLATIPLGLAYLFIPLPTHPAPTTSPPPTETVAPVATTSPNPVKVALDEQMEWQTLEATLEVNEIVQEGIDNPLPPTEEQVAQLSDRVDRVLRAETTGLGRLTAMAAAVGECYVEGAPELARKLLDAEPQLVNWNEVPKGVKVTAQHTEYGEVVLRVERETSGAPLVVCFPPGSMGKSLDTSRQDMIFERAPLVALASHAKSAEAAIPAHCAGARLQPPRPGDVYLLIGLRHDAPLRRVAVQLCAGEEPRSRPEAQLAVWIAHNGLTQRELLEMNPPAQTLDGQPVTLEHARGAAQLLFDSGIDPTNTPFFSLGPSS